MVFDKFKTLRTEDPHPNGIPNMKRGVHTSLLALMPCMTCMMGLTDAVGPGSGRASAEIRDFSLPSLGVHRAGTGGPLFHRQPGHGSHSHFLWRRRCVGGVVRFSRSGGRVFGSRASSRLSRTESFSPTSRPPPPLIGAGVLALPQSLGYLGWVAGPILIITFYVISLLCSWCVVTRIV